MYFFGRQAQNNFFTVDGIDNILRVSQRMSKPNHLSSQHQYFYGPEKVYQDQT